MKYWTTMNSPIGELTLVGSDEALHAIHFATASRTAVLPAGAKRDAAAFTNSVHQLNEYFSGDRRDFDLQLQPDGTAFQKKVWHALLGIGYGETVSYGDIARRINNPKGVRAVGLANGRNPIPVIIPCHRVIGSNGTLTGYAGGIEIKKRLLDLEGATYRA